MTDVRGNYKLASFLVNEDTIQSLAFIIESDQINQGRVKKFIKRQILSLFTSHLGKEIGNQYEFIYENVEPNPLHPSNFKRREISRSIYNIPSFHHEGDATIPYEGKDIPVVADIPICDTCKSLLIYYPNLKGQKFDKNQSISSLRKGMDKFLLPFTDRLPKEIRSETLKKYINLLIEN